MSWRMFSRLVAFQVYPFIRMLEWPLTSLMTAVLKYLLQEKLIDGNTMTVTGKTLGENLEKAADLPHGQDVIRPISNPIKSTGHIR